MPSPVPTAAKERIRRFLRLFPVLLSAALASQSLLPGQVAAQAGAVPAPAMFYVTDRNSQGASPQQTIYGIERSASMAFGALRPGGDSRGETMVARELVRFPRTPVLFSQKSGRIIPDALGSRAYQVQSADFQSRIGAALRASGQRDVILYVHGVNNDFDQAARTTQVLWDASGRAGVPVTFSWPAGHSGLFGYFKDRENGEFSVFHLKETLRLLAGVPGLRAIQVVAHSRGSDVASTALREMVIAARASGRNPRDVLKIDNLIMAAPDLDFGIVSQRLIAEQFGPAFRRISVYMNPQDGMLGLSQSLMSGTRFGRLTIADMGPQEREIFARIRNVDFIDVENVVTRSRHGYFRQNPAVLADIGTLLRQSLPPDDPRRYLRRQSGNFWLISNPPRPGDAASGRGGEAR